MKASYFVNEYANTLLLYYENKNEQAINNIITKIYMTLCDDVKEICETRHSHNINTLFGAIKEVNDKWNAIGRGFKKKIGLPVLAKNGFVKLLFEQMPQIESLYVRKYGPIC